MREYKFRGKRIDNGEWVYGDLVRHYENQRRFIACDQLSYNYTECGIDRLVSERFHEVKSTTVGQYTGLKGKNGKEIYEGDIVAFEDSDGGYEYQDIVVNTGIVVYEELGFCFTNRVAVDMDDFYIKDGRCDDVEVIGNIYENPELMEVTE